MKRNAYIETIRNIHAPASSVEKALRAAQSRLSEAEPVTAAKTIPLSRQLLIAASFILITVLSVALSLRITQTSLPVAQSAETVASPSQNVSGQTDETNQANSSEAPSAPSGTTPPETEIATELSTDADGNIIVTVITRIITTEEDPTEGNHAEPSENSSRPTQPSNAPQTEKPDDPVPTQAHTETEEPLPTEPCAPPTQPESTRPPVVQPTLYHFVAPISDEIRNNEEYVYCRIYDQNGVLLGSDDLFADDHKVTVDQSRRTVEYFPANYGIRISQTPYFDYFFYTQDGTDFYQNRIFL